LKDRGAAGELYIGGGDTGTCGERKGLSSLSHVQDSYSHPFSFSASTMLLVIARLGVQ